MIAIYRYFCCPQRSCIVGAQDFLKEYLSFKKILFSLDARSQGAWNVVGIMFFVMAGISYAADPIYNMETWSSNGTANWTNEATTQVELSNPGGRLNASHLAQTAPTFVEDVVKVPVASGSYITDISFNLSALDYRPSKVRLQFHSSESDNVWSLNVTLPDAGYQVVVDASVAFAEGWFMRDGSEAQFQIDRQTIDWIGVYIRRNGDPAEQNYSIDDFLVQGLFYIVDHDSDGIADSWEVAHGLNTNDVNDAALDRDGDGVSNYEEYRAGTNPEDDGSMFWAEIDKVLSGGETVAFELRWDSATNRNYTVWRSSDLNGNFSKIVEGIHSTPPENIYRYPAETNAPAYFYQIEVEPEL